MLVLHLSTRARRQIKSNQMVALGKEETPFSLAACLKATDKLSPLILIKRPTLTMYYLWKCHVYTMLVPIASDPKIVTDWSRLTRVWHRVTTYTASFCLSTPCWKPLCLFCACLYRGNSCTFRSCNGLLQTGPVWPGACFSKVPKVFRRIWVDINPSVSSKVKLSKKTWKFANICSSCSWKYVKGRAFLDKRIIAWKLASRARKRFATFEKRGPRRL